jgi:hypothetical protein
MEHTNCIKFARSFADVFGVKINKEFNEKHGEIIKRKMIAMKAKNFQIDADTFNLPYEQVAIETESCYVDEDDDFVNQIIGRESTTKSESVDINEDFDKWLESQRRYLGINANIKLI